MGVEVPKGTLVSIGGLKPPYKADILTDSGTIFEFDVNTLDENVIAQQYGLKWPPEPGDYKKVKEARIKDGSDLKIIFKG